MDADDSKKDGATTPGSDANSGSTTTPDSNSGSGDSSGSGGTGSGTGSGSGGSTSGGGSGGDSGGTTARAEMRSWRSFHKSICSVVQSICCLNLKISFGYKNSMRILLKSSKFSWNFYLSQSEKTLTSASTAVLTAVVLLQHQFCCTVDTGIIAQCCQCKFCIFAGWKCIFL